MTRIAAGILFVAAVATAGDYVWFEMGVREQTTTGAIHGAVLLGSVGLVLGWLAGRIAVGLLAGVAAGVGGAAAYYALASFGGRGMNLPAMVAAWAAVWVVLAAMDGRVLRRAAPRPWADILMRGIAAAILGGFAFYFAVDVIWGGRMPLGERNYLIQFAAWTLAWSPGIVAIAFSPGSGKHSG